MNDQNNVINAFPYDSCPLNQVLQLLRLDVEIYHNAKVCGNWHMDSDQRRATTFHIVTQGECWLEAADSFSGVLSEGDLVIFPKELPHSLKATHKIAGRQQHLSFDEGRDIDGTGLLCGEVHFRHQGSEYLLNSLPSIWMIRADDAKDWLIPLMMLIAQENMNPGPAGGVIFDRISELLFSYAVRHYLMSEPTETNILALYGHERLLASVRAIHQHPTKTWTLEQLATKANMSRTVFAEKFRAVSGWTAGQYITWWRMQLAWDALKQGSDIVSTAEKVGYKSEAAFSRAFKKSFDISPGKVRQKIGTYVE